MTEKILLVPGANGTELVRMLARFGKNTLGLRIMNAAEFAKFALMHSGIVLGNSFLPRKQEPAVVDGFVREIPYFSSASYADSEKIANALYSIRSLIRENEREHLHRLLPGGEFPEKNESLVTIYDRYLAALREAKHIDTIGMIRKAMEEAEPLVCPVYTLREYPLTPLEDALANRLSGDRIDSSLPQLLGKDAVQLQNIDYTESYGSSNEIEAIYDYIADRNIPFDECTVAIANTTQYAQLFYDFSQSHGLPITFGCGIPILNTNPAKLLKLIYEWNTTGYNGTDALRVLLHSDAIDYNKLRSALGIEHAWQLDKIISIAGQLRLGCYKEENSKKLAALPRDDKLGDKNDDKNIDYYSCVAELSEELSLGESKLIKKYARIRDGAIGRADRSALAVICDALDTYAKYTGGSLNQIIPQILQKSVCSENSREGSLFVTDISGAMASMRKHLFVAGMSASSFPGTPRENYLLLDSDYLLFADEKTTPTSINRIQGKKDALDHLLTLASALGVNTHISYSGYDLAALKEENPSSALFDIFKKQHGEAATLKKFKDDFRHVGYFGQWVSGYHTVGRTYVQGKDICAQDVDFSQMPCAYTGDQAFSPTAIDDFFNCPRHFFLTRILGVQEQETDDPFVVIDPAANGRLAHSLMEELAHNPCDRDTFMQRAKTAFDTFLLSRPPILKDNAAMEKGTFCRMMENAYDSDPGNKVLASEEDQSFRHTSGVLLSGIPDRVEQTAQGEYIIADYKTGKLIRHQADDIATCLQVVIYAYLLEQRGVRITRCEYRYLRHGSTVSCRYDAAMKEKLNARLLEFKNALDTGEFPPANNKENCTYCKLAGICGKQSQKKEAV